MAVKTKLSYDILSEIKDYQNKKKVLDSSVSLSKEDEKVESFSVTKVEDNEGYMTLLSEGSLLYKDDTIRLYIAKGTLKRFYDSLDSSYEGYITVGHTPVDSTPVRQGFYRKEDLKLVKDESGRYDLLVKPYINTELSAIKDLIIQDEPFAISAEIVYYDMIVEDGMIDEYAKLAAYNISKGGDYFVNITDEVYIKGFSFVSNPGNAKSGSYEPSKYLVNRKDIELDKKELLEKVIAHLNKEQVENAEPAKDSAEEAAEKQQEPVDDKKEEAKESDVSELLEKAAARIEELEAENKTLTERVSELEASEDTVKEQFDKLEQLLSKASVQGVEENKKEEKHSTGLRKRFGGL